MVDSGTPGVVGEILNVRSGTTLATSGRAVTSLKVAASAVRRMLLRIQKDWNWTPFEVRSCVRRAWLCAAVAVRRS
jgi:hypothetical protein